MVKFAMNNSRTSAIRLIAQLFCLLGLMFPLVSQAATNNVQDSAPLSLEIITLLGDKTKDLPEFELTDHNLKPFGKSRLKDKWNLMFFGYTNCPDVCPNTLSTMDNILGSISDPAIRKAVKVYFVSVDPQRDSPEKLGAYMNYFNPDFIAATGDMDKIKVLTSSLGIAHKITKKKDSDSAYSVSHSGFVVLINPDAQFSGLFFSETDNIEGIASDLTKLISKK